MEKETIKIHEGSLGDKKGWAFSVYYGDNTYPNLISALYRTKTEVKEQVKRYELEGTYDWYGSAE